MITNSFDTISYLKFHHALSPPRTESDTKEGVLVDIFNIIFVRPDISRMDIPPVAVLTISGAIMSFT